MVYSFILDFLPINRNEDEYFDIILIISLLFIQLYLATSRFSGMNFIAFMGTTCVLFLGFVVILEFPVSLKSYLSEGKNAKYYTEDINYFNIKSFSSLVKAVCVYFYSFQFHAGSLIIIENFSDKSEERIKKIFFDSVLISFIFYYVVMLLGYLSNLQSNQEIFINSSNSSIYLSFAKFFYSISLIFNISFTYVISKKYMENLISAGQPELLSKRSKLLLTFAVLTVLMLLAFTFESVINILSLIGGSTQTVHMFLIPLLLHMNKPGLSLIKKILTGVLLIILLFLGLFSLLFFIYDFASNIVNGKISIFN